MKLPELDFEQLLEQAGRAPWKKRLAARGLFCFFLLAVASTLGGVTLGFSFADALWWGLSLSASVALVCIAPMTIIEQLVARAGAPWIAWPVGILSWSAALVVCELALALPYGLDAAAHAAEHLIGSLGESARPWLLTIGPGAGIGIAFGWRNKPARLTYRFALGLIVMFGVAGVLFGAEALSIELPRWLIRTLLLALSLPMAMLVHVILLLADALSMAGAGTLPGRSIGPRPGLPPTDRLLCLLYRHPGVDLAVVVASIAAGMYDYGPLLGLVLGVACYLLFKFWATLALMLWIRRLESRDQIDRAANCWRDVQHGRAARDHLAANATLSLAALLVRHGRTDEAERELERLGSLDDALPAARLHDLAVSWIGAGLPDRALDAMDSWKKPLPRGLQVCWPTSRAAALLDLDRAQEAADLLESLPTPKSRGLAAALHNNLAVALLQLGRDLDRAMQLASEAKQQCNVPATRSTMGAALTANGQHEDAIHLLAPLVEAPEPRLSDRAMAFRCYWLAIALRHRDEAAARSMLRRAASLTGVWAGHAEVALGELDAAQGD